MTFFTECDKDTEAVGAALAKALEQGGIRRAFIAMRGEMGVGKTAFTRGFASHFGICGVKSPTYTVVNEYAGKCRIFHFDMYRIADLDDLYSIGYDDYVERDGYCIAEWSENIEDALPEDAIYVTISRTESECGRRIDISYDNVSL
jgi:tRNA threonylcarbamoyladenosine biosynthesis protein TsaE